MDKSGHIYSNNIKVTTDHIQMLIFDSLYYYLRFHQKQANMLRSCAF